MDIMIGVTLKILSKKNGQFAKIVDIDKSNGYDLDPYKVSFPSKCVIFLHKDEIKRKLTNEEIKQYELENNANNYNL